MAFDFEATYPSLLFPNLASAVAAATAVAEAWCAVAAAGAVAEAWNSVAAAAVVAEAWSAVAAAGAVVEAWSAVAVAAAVAEAWILELAFAVEKIHQDAVAGSEGIPGLVAELEGTPLEKCARAVLACWVRQMTVMERDADLEHLRSVAFCGASWISWHLSPLCY